MATFIGIHDVDDVEHWLSSPQRAELFGPLGITVRTFVVDRASRRQTAVLLEVPDLAAFEQVMASPAVAAAMKVDGVHPDTFVLYTEIK